MFRALIPVLLVSTACAQTAADAARLGELIPLLESREADTLRCSIMGLPPVLDFSLRLQAAYTVHVPTEQFQGPGHRLNFLVRVRPEAGGKPVYLVSGASVPDTPPASQSLEL